MLLGNSFFFFFLGGKDIHYTSAKIATSRVCDVHHKPKRPKLTVLALSDSFCAVCCERRRETTSQHLRHLPGVAKRQKTEFHGGPYKDLQRHAFSEVTVAAPLPEETPFIPLRMSSGNGWYRSKAV